MKIRHLGQLGFAIVAAAALSGCVTGYGGYGGYGYRGGAGDYYYGQPSAGYYGDIGYSSGGYGGYGGYGYGGYDYGYGGYGYGYPYGYGYSPYYYYPNYPYYPRPRPRPETRPPRHGGVTLPDNGVRYTSRYETLQRQQQQQAIQAQERADGDEPSQPRYQSRYQPRTPQINSGLESRNSGRSGLPYSTSPTGPAVRYDQPQPRFESRVPQSEPRFESRAPRVESGNRDTAPPRSSSRERDSSRFQTP